MVNGKKTSRKYRHGTFYWESDELYNAVKKQNINVSRIVNTALEAVVFGDHTSNLKQKMKMLEQQEQKHLVELTAIRRQLETLQTLYEERQKTHQDQKELYQRFIQNARSRVDMIIRDNIHITSEVLTGIKKAWRHNYFRQNGLTNKDVSNILEKVNDGKFSFKMFMEMRGENQ